MIPSILSAFTILVAVVAILVGRRIQLFSQFCPETFGDHVFAKELDPSCHYFSMTYEEARHRFREECNRAGCSMESIPIGEGEDTIDIGILRGELSGLVVHTSGVHGVEGYIGSAIQTAFLSKHKAGEKMPTVVFIHAFNPYGMRLYRRANENNVDLNRNALTDEEWQSFASNHYNRETYDSFNSFFNPPKAPSSYLMVHVEFWIKGLLTLAFHGLSSLRAAMVGGQYHNPKGIFYGGDKVEASTTKIREWMIQFLPLFPHSKVTWIDVHTGLGPFGVDTLLTRPTSELVPDRNMNEEFQKWFPDSHNPFIGDTKKAQKVSQGYDRVRGFVPDLMERLLTREQDPLLLVQEIGTIPSILVGQALILENMAFQYLSKDDDDEALKWAKWTTLRAFYPQSREWREMALQNGLRVLENAIKRSSR